MSKNVAGHQHQARRTIARRALCAIAIATAIGWNGVARADDFQVNAYTYYEQKFPDMCSDSNGNFVVVWESYYQDYSGFGIFARLFDSSFSPISGDFQVNTSTLGDQGTYYSGPAVACDDNLNFVVVWPSTYPFDAVWGRQFDNLGIPAGTAFVVNTYNNYSYPGYNNVDVAMNPANGNFVVVWDSYSQDGHGYGVFGQRFGSSGATVGTEFQVNTYTYYDQGGSYRNSDIAVAMDPNGRFVVVWGSNYQDGDAEGVFGRQFNSAGVGAGEFQVNTYTYGYQGWASIDVAKDSSGRFVVAWNDYNQDGYGTGVFAQRFTSFGSKSGTEFQVNTYTYGYQGGYRYNNDGVAVAYEPGGGFEVAWESYYQDGQNYGIFAQRYSSSGAPSGTEFQVNTYTYYGQSHPTVAGHGAGDFVVAWQGYYELSDYDRTGIFGQGPPGPTPTPTPPDCPATPNPVCATPGKGKLLIKDKAPAGPSAKDKIIYKWLKGPAVNQSDFGNPSVNAGTDIFICIYDNSGRVAKLTAPASATLWKPLGTSGYSYKDTSLGNDGLQKVLLKGGGAGKSKIIVKAKDGNIPNTNLPLDASANITVQVHRSDGGPCWQTVMAGATSTNDPDQFKGQFP